MAVEQSTHVTPEGAMGLAMLWTIYCTSEAAKDAVSRAGFNASNQVTPELFEHVTYSVLRSATDVSSIDEEQARQIAAMGMGDALIQQHTETDVEDAWNAFFDWTGEQQLPTHTQGFYKEKPGDFFHVVKMLYQFGLEHWQGRDLFEFGSEKLAQKKQALEDWVEDGGSLASLLHSSDEEVEYFPEAMDESGEWKLVATIASLDTPSYLLFMRALHRTMMGKLYLTDEDIAAVAEQDIIDNSMLGA